MNNSTVAETDNSKMNFHVNSLNIASACFVAVLMLLTLAGNITVCVCFYRYHDLRTICNYFIISLSVSDILVALLAMPIWLVIQFSDLLMPLPLPAGLQLLWSSTDILVGTASILNLVAVSFDRYLAITKPFSYSECLTSSRAIKIIAALWVFSLTLFAVRLPLKPESTQMKGFQVVTVFLAFIIPLLVMILVYAKIYSVARNQALRIGRNYARDIKATKTIAIVIGAFLICWMPFFIVVTMFAFEGIAAGNMKIPVFKAIKWLEYLNSCLNPMIYNFTNRAFRRAFKKLFRSLCSSRNCYSSEHLNNQSIFHKTKAETMSDSSSSISQNGNICNTGNIILQESEDKMQGSSV